MKNWFAKLLLCGCMIAALVCACALAEENATVPAEESAQVLYVTPDVSVVYLGMEDDGPYSVVMQPEQESLQVKNGGIFLITASCRTAESIARSMNPQAMAGIGRLPNQEGMALLGFYFAKLSDDGVSENVMEIIDFLDPTSGQIPLYGLEPGSYMLYVEGVAAMDGQEMDGQTVNGGTGWLKYRFEIVE